MTTTETATEREAIASVIRLYIEGASKGDAAKLKEAFHEQAFSFTDFLSLARIDGSWKIVSKTFAHTGGEMPTP